MHSPDTCSASCGCACPACQLAGEHPRHAGPLTAPTERDPLTPALDAELAHGATRCCDWSSGHHPGSPVDELAHGHVPTPPAVVGDGYRQDEPERDRELTRAGLR